MACWYFYQLFRCKLCSCPPPKYAWQCCISVLVLEVGGLAPCLNLDVPDVRFCEDLRLLPRGVGIDIGRSWLSFRARPGHSLVEWHIRFHVAREMEGLSVPLREV
jgi:hypothetical protein